MKRFTSVILCFALTVSMIPLFDINVSALDVRVEKAIDWAISIANDDTHGYSQENRNGPDYDCSSFVSTAFKKGGFTVSGSLGTANMLNAFLSIGFTKYNLGTVTLQRGDILLRPRTSSRGGHTELYIGNNQCVAAHDNYDDQSGDGNGREIQVRYKSDCYFCKYQDYIYILRYEGHSEQDDYTYSFSFNANGGELSSSQSFTTKYNEKFTIPNVTCEKEGYEWVGWIVKRNNDSKWFTGANGWLTEEKINSNGYSKKLYQSNQTLTLDDSWISGIADDCSYTFYAQWAVKETVATFDLNYDDIHNNMFRAPCDSVTVNGITYEYDSATGIMTLNGTTSQSYAEIAVVPFWAYVGDIYTASCYYVSGSVTNGVLNYDVCGKDGYRLANRQYLSCFNSDSSAVWEFVNADATNTENENAAGSYLKLWVDNNTSESNVVFNNYRIKIKLEKGTKTIYSPARTVLTVENYNNDLPTVYRKGYMFDGWYTDPTEKTTVGASVISSSGDHITLYAHWTACDSVVTFNPNYSGINANMFRSPTDKTEVNGITYSYDETTGIITLNGTTAQTITQLGLVPFYVGVGDIYTASCQYVSGSVTNGNLFYDVCGKDGYRLSDRKYLSCSNNNTSSVWTFEQLDPTDISRENSAGSYLKLWVDNTGENDVVFDNYKIKIKLEKGDTATAYSPARQEVTVDDNYTGLPTISRDGYTFLGWFTEAQGGEQITEETVCSSADYKTVYAHWKANEAVVTFNVNNGKINPNMFKSPCDEITVNGITYTYDNQTGILTLNGTAAQAVTQIGVVPFWVNVGDVYTASCYYISGSVKYGELCYDVCGSDGYRLSDRKYLACKNTDSSSTWSFTVADSTNTENANSAGSSLKLWVDNNTEAGDVVFDNYKIKIKLEKGQKTDYSPARTVISTGNITGNLPDALRVGYIFDGWYTAANGGEKITDSKVCNVGEYLTLYAHWYHDTFDLKNDTLIVDSDNRLVSGTDLFGITQTQLLSQFSNENMNVIMANDTRMSTGTVLQLIDSDHLVYDTLTVVIFGDVNGDGWYDGNDAFLVNLIVNGMLDKDDVDEAVWTAADCNHDGVIDENDVDLLTGAGLLLNNVDQSATQAELETNAFYIEYMSLIDQSVEINADASIKENINTDDNAGNGLDRSETEMTDGDENITDKFNVERIIADIFEFFKKVITFIFSLISI